MNITELFSPDLSKVCKVGITNKKKVLEKISKLISAYDTQLNYHHILSALQQREKMGCTALGHKVAIPHARVASAEKPLCVVLLLENPIDFSSTEIQPVDLIFGLIVPEDYVEEHLQLLAKITEKLHDEKARQTLQASENNQTLYHNLLTLYEHT